MCLRVQYVAFLRALILSLAIFTFFPLFGAKGPQKNIFLIYSVCHDPQTVSDFVRIQKFDISYYGEFKEMKILHGLTRQGKKKL